MHRILHWWSVAINPDVRTFAARTDDACYMCKYVLSILFIFITGTSTEYATKKKRKQIPHRFGAKNLHHGHGPLRVRLLCIVCHFAYGALCHAAASDGWWPLSMSLFSSVIVAEVRFQSLSFVRSLAVCVSKCDKCRGSVPCTEVVATRCHRSSYFAAHCFKRIQMPGHHIQLDVEWLAPECCAASENPQEISWMGQVKTDSTIYKSSDAVCVPLYDIAALPFRTAAMMNSGFQSGLWRSDKAPTQNDEFLWWRTTNVDTMHTYHFTQSSIPYIAGMAEVDMRMLGCAHRKSQREMDSKFATINTEAEKQRKNVCGFPLENAWKCRRNLHRVWAQICIRLLCSFTILGPPLGRVPDFARLFFMVYYCISLYQRPRPRQ